MCFDCSWLAADSHWSCGAANNRTAACGERWPLRRDFSAPGQLSRMGTISASTSSSVGASWSGIKPLGTSAELRPLELFDDRLKALDLTVADDGCHIAHETLVEIDVGGQICTIELHTGFCFRKRRRC